MSSYESRVPPLFWIKDLQNGGVVHVTDATEMYVCFFSTEDKACDYADSVFGSPPGREWESVGSEFAGDVQRICEGAASNGYAGWVLDVRPAASASPHLRTWGDLSSELERKIKTDAAWS